MAVLIVAGVLVASLGTFGAIGRARQSQVQRAEALSLAERMMAEIVQCYFQDPSGATIIGRDDGETTRAAFDDVDDYDNWQAAPPTRRDGTALPGYAGWKIKVRVRHVLPDTANVESSTVTGLKRIRVTVMTRDDIEHTLVALRSSGGAYEQVPTSTVNYLTWGGVEVRVGEQGRPVYGGAHPLNVTTSQ